MAAKPLPDIAYLRECFTYDPETGVLRWRGRPREHFADLRSYVVCNIRDAGQVAGSSSDPQEHLRVCVGGVSFKISRIIWKFMTGSDPVVQIDHINGDYWDNRWANLREATHAQNTQNCGLRIDNISGQKGVHFAKRSHKWIAYINVSGKRKFLGTFQSYEEAKLARIAAEKDGFGIFARI